jgi:hypothetical protein
MAAFSVNQQDARGNPDRADLYDQFGFLGFSKMMPGSQRQTDDLEVFRRRVKEEWLPVYCGDPKKQYSLDGFKDASIRLDATDARDCMRAIDSGVVQHVAHGRYRAFRGTATETLFWEGSRTKAPRPTTLWLEPAITFAALARLHFDHAWPVDLLGNQPSSWAFDLAAHECKDATRYRILGEVKKTVREAETLLAELQQASAKQDATEIRPNSAQKWRGLLRARPPLMWIVGPAGYSRVFHCTYQSDSALSLQETAGDALQFAAA